MTKGLLNFALAALALLTVVSTRATAGTVETAPEIPLKRGEIRFTKFEVEKDGERKTYSVDARVTEFYLSDDSYLAAGAKTKCDPFIGKTTQDLTFDANVEEVVNRGYNTQTYETVYRVVKAKAPATILVKKGTDVFGRCGEKSDVLIAVGFASREADTKIEVKY